MFLSRGQEEAASAERAALRHGGGQNVFRMFIDLGCKAIAGGSGRAVEVIDKAVADAVYGDGKFFGLTVSDPQRKSFERVITHIYMYQFRSVRGGAPAIWLVTLYNTRNIP